MVDFLDPALADQPDIRERGVRVEIRPVSTGGLNTIYSSPDVALRPAITRIDLLESAPHKADRMHFHPDMVDGEPEDRTFDERMSEDPLAWLRTYLMNLNEPIGQSDADAIASSVDDIIGVTEELLAAARQPWPDVVHNERGLVVG